MGLPDNQLPENLLQNFDADLQIFYYFVIRKEIRYRENLYAPYIKNAVKEIVEAYKKENTSKSSSALRFNTRKKRSAYILKHSPCFTSAVSLHFMNLVIKNHQILHEPLQNNDLKVCCLGGGPASEVVALTKILGPLYRTYKTEKSLKLKMSVTIVDINEDWKNTCKNVLEGLQWSKEFEEDIDRIDFDLQFIKADLSLPMDDTLKNVVGSADILTMVYFVSAVNGGKDKEESFIMVKDIMRTIKVGAILFFLDSATDVHYEQMYRAAKELGNLDVVYGPCLEYLHCLSIESVRKFLEIYKTLYNKFICMTHSFMSYCVWRKSEKCMDSTDADEKAKLETVLLGKNNPDLTQKMVDYRKEIEAVLEKEFRPRNWREKGFEKSNEPGHWKETEMENPYLSGNRRGIESRSSNMSEKSNLKEIKFRRLDRSVNGRQSID